MNINGIYSKNGMLGSISKNKGIEGIAKPKEVEADKQSVNFGEIFVNAVKEVDSLQKEADNNIEGMVTGKGVTPHEAMISLEKADLAFQLMNQIRSKIVRAYEELMRTQI